MHLTTLITTLFLSNAILLTNAAPSDLHPARQADPGTPNPFEQDIELIFPPTHDLPGPQLEAAFLPRLTRIPTGPFPIPTRLFPTRTIFTDTFPDPTFTPTPSLRTILYQGTYLFGTPTLVTADWDILFYSNGTLRFTSHIHQLGSTSCLSSYVIACAEVDAEGYMYLQAHSAQGLDICVNQHEIKESWWDISFELLAAREKIGWKALTQANGEMVCRVRLGDDAVIGEVVDRLRESVEGRNGRLTGETILLG